jgi:hypothetical protein
MGYGLLLLLQRTYSLVPVVPGAAAPKTYSHYSVVLNCLLELL